jgi:hypothetical protein
VRARAGPRHARTCIRFVGPNPTLATVGSLGWSPRGTCAITTVAPPTRAAATCGICASRISSRPSASTAAATSPSS